MNQSGNDPTLPPMGGSSGGGGESPAATIARLEAVVARLRDALARQPAGGNSGAADVLAAENARLRDERDRLSHQLADLRNAYDGLKQRSDSAGFKINRTIQDLETMLGEGS